MPGSTGPISSLGRMQEASAEPLALSGALHIFFWLGFVATELIVRRGQIIFVVFQIQSKSWSMSLIK